MCISSNEDSPVYLSFLTILQAACFEMRWRRPPALIAILLFFRIYSLSHLLLSVLPAGPRLRLPCPSTIHRYRVGDSSTHDTERLYWGGPCSRLYKVHESLWKFFEAAVLSGRFSAILTVITATVPGLRIIQLLPAVINLYHSIQSSPSSNFQQFRSIFISFDNSDDLNSFYQPRQPPPTSTASHQILTVFNFCSLPTAFVKPLRLTSPLTNHTGKATRQHQRCPLQPIPSPSRRPPH